MGEVNYGPGSQHKCAALLRDIALHPHATLYTTLDAAKYASDDGGFDVL